MVMRYPGGKGRCYQHLISLMPAHRTYIETHLGGGAVLRNKRPAEESIAIELDERVLARWRNLHPDLARYVLADAARFLEDYDFRGGELVYCDPPYPRATRRKERIYRHDYSDKDHLRLLDVLTQLPCMVIVSSYLNDMYATRLASWRAVTFQGDSHTGPRTEAVWLNFPATDDLHDFRFVGADFRERERLRRRREAIARRVARLPSIEQRAVLQELALRFGARDLAVPTARGQAAGAIAGRHRRGVDEGGCS